MGTCNMQYGRNRVTRKSNFGQILVLANIFLIAIFQKTNCVIELRFTAQISTSLAQSSTIKKNTKFEKCGANRLFNRPCPSVNHLHNRHRKLW